MAKPSRFHVSGPGLSAGINVDSNDVCVSAEAPVVQWMVGRDLSWLKGYCKVRGWSLDTLWMPRVSFGALKGEPVVMRNSPEAAQLVTVTGWRSRRGYFFGLDERTARYNGCTHVHCSCGRVIEKGRTKCSDCRGAAEVVKYNAMPKKVWDGTGMLYSEAADRYFSNWDEVEDFLAEEEEAQSADSLLLVICEPQYASEIEEDEHYCDSLPEDCTVADADKELAAMFDELNSYIRENKPVLSWYPGKFAVDLSVSQ